MDSNPGHLVQEATALSTVPQPLPYRSLLLMLTILELLL